MSDGSNKSAWHVTADLVGDHGWRWRILPEGQGKALADSTYQSNPHALKYFGSRQAAMAAGEEELLRLIRTGGQHKARKTKRPRDTNQLAKSIVDAATGDGGDSHKSKSEIRAQKAGSKGGPARAKALTPAQRSEIARTAAEARWKKGS